MRNIHKWDNKIITDPRGNHTCTKTIAFPIHSLFSLSPRHLRFFHLPFYLKAFSSKTQIQLINFIRCTFIHLQYDIYKLHFNIKNILRYLYIQRLCNINIEIYVMRIIWIKKLIISHFHAPLLSAFPKGNAVQYCI